MVPPVDPRSIGFRVGSGKRRNSRGKVVGTKRGEDVAGSQGRDGMDQRHIAVVVHRRWMERRSKRSVTTDPKDGIANKNVVNREEIP